MNKSSNDSAFANAQRLIRGRVIMMLVFQTVVLFALTGCQSPGRSISLGGFELVRTPSPDQDSGRNLNETSEQQQDTLTQRARQESLDYQIRRPIEPFRSDPGVQQAGYQEASHQPQQTNDRRPYEASQHSTYDPGFHANEMARMMPRSATEMVVELSADLRAMRNEMTDLKQVVDSVKRQNQELQAIRTELNNRLVTLETELQATQLAEARTRQEFEQMSLRVQQFNMLRQKQIGELNQVIDQFEQQLRRSLPMQPPMAGSTRDFRNTSQRDTGNHLR